MITNDQSRFAKMLDCGVRVAPSNRNRAERLNDVGELTRRATPLPRSAESWKQLGLSADGAYIRFETR